MSHKRLSDSNTSYCRTKKIKRNIRFDIVGYGELEGKIRNWIKEYEITDITTIYINPDNIPELLEQADIYISTSLFEGTSNSIMEAMNANLPIVATKVGDNEYLIHSNENGYLCDVGDYQNISKLLLKLITDYNLRITLGKQSKVLLSEEFSMDLFKNRYLSFLE